MGRRIRVLSLFGVGALVLSVTAALAGSAATPGVSSKQVVIGGTFPLTGPAQLYSVIPKAENAYYQYVNARGGVNKRKIVFKVLDDQYSPPKTVPLITPSALVSEMFRSTEPAPAARLTSRTCS